MNIINHIKKLKNNFHNFHFIGMMLGAVSVITFFLLIMFSGTAKPEHSVYDNSPFVVSDSFERFTVVAAGDAMSHMSQVTSAYNPDCKCYDYTTTFQYIRPIFKNSDLAFINYETTNAGLPYQGYPKFSAPDTVAWFLKNAGFNFFVNANNHVNDRGIKGVLGTLNVFDRYNIRHTGVFSDSAERKKNYPYILREKGFKFAILNYTYGTNEMPTIKPTIVNTIDTIRMRADMQAAKDSMPDAIIVLMHWGTEYKREPGPDQKPYADFLFRNGADVIIGSHPHVVQPIEYCNFTYNGKPKTGLVIWSLGNFVANQRRHYTNGGIFVRFDIARNIYTGKIKIDNVYYIPVWVYKQAVPAKFFALPVSLFEHDSTTFKMNDSDKIAFKTFAIETRQHLARDTTRIKEYFLKN
jgi:poly-gamma-glutamate synthesis protein (capsule biosynthesis protein)